MQQKIYQAALIGCGRIGYSLGLDKKREQPASHTMALNENARIKLVAGCDTDAAALQKWQAANRRAVIYGDSANLYARHKPDIVVIAVNESSHMKEAVSAIVSRPRLVILEKPVALSMDEALRIKREAERNGVPVLVNHERRFALDYDMARSYIKRIGTVQGIHARLSSSMAVYNSKEEHTGAYSLIHDGTHLVDAVLFFLEALNDGEVSSVREITAGGEGLLKRAMGMSKDVRYENTFLKNPVITGLFKDEGGAVRNMSAHYITTVCPDVTISMSGRSKFFGFEILIDGTEGRICIGNGYLKLYRRQESTLYTGFYSLMSDGSVKVPRRTMYFANMVQNAVDFLDGTAALKSTLQTGINSLAVLEEIKNKL
ncbi:MAG: Gfo/Idh/MocA family oxidoreductase [Treponema sp.]|nr:Gfo/Idh/MocA family oxidoreductase [Treponema sp.]